MSDLAHSFLYLPGVTPVIFLNIRLKVFVAPKPHSNAISAIERDVSESRSFFAYSMRYIARNFEK